MKQTFVLIVHVFQINVNIIAVFLEDAVQNKNVIIQKKIVIC